MLHLQEVAVVSDQDRKKRRASSWIPWPRHNFIAIRPMTCEFREHLREQGFLCEDAVQPFRLVHKRGLIELHNRNPSRLHSNGLAIGTLDGMVDGTHNRRGWTN